MSHWSEPCVLSTDFHNRPCWCQLDRNCDLQTSTTTNVVDDTAYSSASAQSWTRTTAADGQIFGGKIRPLSEPTTSRPVENRNFYLHGCCIWHHLWGWSHRNFVRERLLHKTSLCRVPGYIVRRCLHDSMFSQLWIMKLWQTDWVIDGYVMTANTALA